LGVRLITYDRPGYGRSRPRPGRSVADAADDVGMIADRLELDRFAVIGRSGGGPHALACAALLPEDRVVGAASLGGLAPFDADALDWFDGMVEMNRRHYAAAASRDRSALNELVVPIVEAMRADSGYLVQQIAGHGTGDDRTRLQDTEYHGMILAGTAESVEICMEGWLADSLAFTRPWGFRLELIRVPVLFWHGRDDTFSPPAHSRWLARRIRGSELIEAPHLSHLAAADAQLDALAWLLELAPDTDRRRQAADRLRDAGPVGGG